MIQADPGGHFIRVVLRSAGPLVAWITTTYGRSEPVLINAPDPRWLSADEAYPGMAVYLCGRNLDPQGYNAHGRTEIQLLDHNGHPAAPGVTITELTSYHAVFTTPHLPPGTYTIAVRTSPNTPWAELAGEPLTVVAATANVDPLNLGVAWTRDFAWTNIHQVTQYGALGDGTTDDTAAIQAGIEALADAGGGVLHFPAGTYNYTLLYLRAGVVLQGASTKETTLAYTPSGGVGFLSVGDGITDGHGGITAITFTVAAGTTITSDFKLMTPGTPWGTPITPDSGRFFIYDTVVDMPVDNTNIDLAAGLGFDGRVLIANNRWKGHSTKPYSPFINNYVTLRDNTFQGGGGEVVFAANRYIAVRNTLTAHFVDGVTGVGDFRGFDCSPGHTTNPPAHIYFAQNAVQEYLSNSNSGESYNFELGSSIFYDGPVVSAAATTATVALDTSPYAGSTWTGFVWQILITTGRGLGQLRTITDHSADNTVLTIDRAWDIIPDATSRYVVLRMMSDIVVENNTATDDTGDCMFYYVIYDSVIAELRSVNTDGASTWGRMLADGVRPAEPTYFTTIRDCVITGESANLQDTSVSMRAAQQTNPATDITTCLYGTEIINNTIDRSACPTGKGGRPQPSGIQASFAEKGITGQGALATLISGNHIANSQIGIDLNSGIDSTLLYHNTYTNVTTPIYDDGSTNTITV